MAAGDNPRPRTGSTRAVDVWLRREGLPTFVPVRRWAKDLPRRSAPVFVWMLGVVAIGAVGLHLLLDVVGEQSGLIFEVLVGVLGLAVLVLPVGLGYLANRLLRVAPHPAVTSWLVILVSTVLGAIISQSLEVLSLSAEFVESAAVLIGLLLVIWLGIGSILAWTFRSAVRNLGAVRHMATIALPVILMLVIFAFYSTEMWQITDTLTWPKIFAFGLMIAVIGITVTMPAATQAVAEARREATETGEEKPALLRLRWWQQLNVMLVLLISQLLMAAIFSTLLGLILVALGKISVTPQTIVTWLGHAPQPWVIDGLTVPVSVNLAKVAAFLGMLAGLSFLISSVSDAQYRDKFFDPIIDRIVEALAARPDSAPTLVSARGVQRGTDSSDSTDRADRTDPEDAAD